MSDHKLLYSNQRDVFDSALTFVIEGACSDQYADGWEFADRVWLKHDQADLNADAPAHWSDEKAIGFWERLALEKRVRNGKGGPCGGCRKFTEIRDLGSGGPYRCADSACVMF